MTGTPEHGALRRELVALSRLAGPVVAVQVGLASMGFVDTWMVGHVSHEALAGIALGNVYSFLVHAFGLGTLMALDPLVAQAIGARDDRAAARAIGRGLVLAALLCAPLALPLLLAEPILRVTRQPSDVVPLAAAFARISIVGLPGFLGFVALRQPLQALHRLRPVLVTVGVANVRNAGLDYGLIHGRLGLPQLGPIGTAWATSASRLLMAAGLLVAAWKDLAHLPRPSARELWSPRALWRLLGLGAPIGAQYVLEIGCFSAVALFMGWMGTVELAAHQIAIQLASLSFMVPMGTSQAAAVRVGHAVGREDQPGVRLSSRAAILFGGAVMLLSCALFLSLPGVLAGAFTNEPQVRALAATLVMIAGIFQVFDGLQVVAIGVLRGLGDTRTPMLVNVLGFTLLATPVGLWLAFALGLGAPGLWWGLVLGLGVVAVTLLVRVEARLRTHVARLHHP